ncbi:YigZ family protein [Granulicatella sp. zg-ZJ]|uniref:YigZ family protein n=1 Tax=Granulicatella sp. zg-ZJ TaxID=2678504 RepID=UPI0013D89BF4|nr:YigZ family protein [Granulicatella sp. zg-ZJ]NEW62680.1 YigZ family protein [Granulicatella sp. zg-ZJ]
MEEYKQIAKDGEAELIIRASRFICALKKIDTEEEALAFIQEKKKEHKKATHNCSAFLIGEHDHIQRAHDDGEPSGTAGVPMLEVLKKNNLHNVVAVVTRYFGGVKLGAGGLIRAYSSAVSNALNHVGIMMHTKQFIVTIRVPYTLSGKFDYFLSHSPYRLLHTDYASDITYTCGILSRLLSDFEQDITQQFNGSLAFVIEEEAYIDLPLEKETLHLSDEHFE